MSIFRSIAQIGLRAPELPGVETDVAFDRAYAYGAATGHVVGHTGSVNRPAMDDDWSLKLPDARVGKTGVELGLERDLSGEVGGDAG